ncbi:MAG: DGQHR domain-containing protein [Syntrophorhabdales bacterium]
MITQEACLLPAIRARMGNWWYYITTMTFKEVAERVKRVRDIHESKSLKTWIQRELKEGRTREIAEYLNSQPQRFFNAVVLGLFQGTPDWYPISVSTGHVETGVELEERVRSAFGLIKLTGHEQIFAIDGQHRVEGIKMALGLDGGSKLAGEELTVIFVAHNTDELGRQRTRRLFTTLNKYAKPVSEGEIVALSEDDTFAIVTRKLVDEYPGLNSEFVPLYKTANIPAQDKRSLTSLISLYRLVRVISVPYGGRASSRLVKGPSDPTTISEFYIQVTEFWEAIKACFGQVAEVCDSRPEAEIAAKYRHRNGGHFLFRPFCLVAFARAVSVLMRRGFSVAEAVKTLATAPFEISEDPWRHVVWNPTKCNMINKNEPLVRNLLLHLAKQALAPKDFDLKAEYANAVGEAQTSFHP